MPLMMLLLLTETVVSFSFIDAFLFSS